MLLFILRLLACVCLVMLSAIDVRDRRLPNLIVLTLPVLYVATAVIKGDGWSMVLMHFGIGLIALILGVGMFAARWFGGGDAKLAAAVFVWTGAALAWPTLLLISLLGSMVALISYLANRASRQHDSGLMYRLASRRGVPYGIALAGGGMFAVLLPAILNLPRF
jgi:prepilin peptidase CpaA